VKTKDFSLRIEPGQLHKLHYIAAYYDRSVNRELLRLVRKHIEAFEKEHGAIETDNEE
jgi:hypothetical protein